MSHRNSLLLALFLIGISLPIGIWLGPHLPQELVVRFGIDGQVASTTGRNAFIYGMPICFVIIILFINAVFVLRNQEQYKQQRNLFAKQLQTQKQSQVQNQAQSQAQVATEQHLANGITLTDSSQNDHSTATTTATTSEATTSTTASDATATFTADRATATSQVTAATASTKTNKPTQVPLSLGQQLGMIFGLVVMIYYLVYVSIIANALYNLNATWLLTGTLSGILLVLGIFTFRKRQYMHYLYTSTTSNYLSQLTPENVAFIEKFYPLVLIFGAVQIVACVALGLLALQWVIFLFVVYVMFHYLMAAALRKRK